MMSGLTSMKPRGEWHGVGCLPVLTKLVARGGLKMTEGGGVRHGASCTSPHRDGMAGGGLKMDAI